MSWDEGVWLFTKREGHDGKWQEVERFRDALCRFERLQTDLGVERLTLRMDGYEVGWYTRNPCLVCDGRGKVERNRYRFGEFDGWDTCAACGGTGEKPRLGMGRERAA